MTVEHVPGKNAGNIMLYALSTCGWCRKTRQLLDNLGVDYYYEYVDMLEGTRKDDVMEKVRRWNPQCTFPTIVINGQKCIVGYKEDDIRRELKI